MENWTLLCTINGRTRTGTCTLGLTIQHVKRGTVRCLYDCARCIVQQGQNLREEEENHLMKAFVGNGDPRSFIHSASTTKPSRRIGHPLSTSLSGCVRTSTSERCSRPDPPSVLSSRTPPPPYGKCVVYEVPCTCGKVYIGETRCQLETRLKEHKDACIKGFTDKSTIAEHA